MNYQPHSKRLVVLNECHISSALFTVVMIAEMEVALGGRYCAGVELKSGELCGIDYRDNLVYLFESTEPVKNALDILR